jgi:endonuclease/exonuclease/phosphatase family metal-dependent hydrolase
VLDYSELEGIADSRRRSRAVAGLRRLRSALHDAMPNRTATGTLLLATWNIREFDSGKYGYRDNEAYYCIAEIISRFDIVAVQEVRDGLYALRRLRRILGGDWDFIVTDVTLGRSGNAERMAYLFDRRKVAFTGLAAELVLPEGLRGSDAALQFARSPFVAGFRAEWAYLTLITVHIYYGEGVRVDPRRLAEITALAGTVAENAPKLSVAPQREPGHAPDPGNVVVLGDFNIFNRADVTMRALTAGGFVVPESLQDIPGSNVDKTKHYDQIAYLRSLTDMTPTGRSGVFDYFEHVYRIADESDYAGDRQTRPGRSFRDWRTYRMSDHLPMWVEFDIDRADDHLSLIAAP